MFKKINFQEEKSTLSPQILSATLYLTEGLPRGLGDKESVRQSKRCKRLEFDPGIRKVPLEEENGNPLQYCLEISNDRGARQAT